MHADGAPYRSAERTLVAQPAGVFGRGTILFLAWSTLPHLDRMDGTATDAMCPLHVASGSLFGPSLRVSGLRLAQAATPRAT